MPVIPINSLDDPRVAPYRNIRDAHLKTPRGTGLPPVTHPTPPRGTGVPPVTPPTPTRGTGVPPVTESTDLTGPDLPPVPLFMAEGEVVVRHLIHLATSAAQASRPPALSRPGIHSLLLTPARREAIEDALARLPPDVPIYLAEQPVMDAITGFHIHRGVLAAGIRPDEPPLADLLAALPAEASLLILEDLANHDNIGGLFRNAAAFGVAAVLLSPRCADPLYRKAIRVSAGHALSVPFTRVAPWPEALAAVKRAGRRLAALVTDGEATPVADWASAGADGERPAAPIALLVGAEGPGLTPAARALADDLVRIPMAAGVDSLNVAVAAAIALHALADRGDATLRNRPTA